MRRDTDTERHLRTLLYARDRELADANARVKKLAYLIAEFADFCEDSGWKNVAEELREKAK